MIQLLENLSPKAAWTLSLLLLGLVGYIDYASGLEISVLAFYLLPIVLISWHRGKRAAVLMALTCTMAWLAADILNRLGTNPSNWSFWNAVMRGCFFLTTGLFCAAARAGIVAQQKLIAELQTARFKISTLSQVLPICPCCRKIRNCRNEWQTVENYLRDESNAEFITSVCPDCSHGVFTEKPASSG